MANQKLATVTNELIESYGNTAKNVINAYRVGNERAVVFMDQRFVAAVNKAGARLSAQARHNAVAAEKKLTAYYVKSVEMTSDNANMVVSKAVELAGKSVVQVAANAGRFEKSTGVKALSTLATAAMPAAQAVTSPACWPARSQASRPRPSLPRSPSLQPSSAHQPRRLFAPARLLDGHGPPTAGCNHDKRDQPPSGWPLWHA
jgi:hypothetical protein